METPHDFSPDTVTPGTLAWLRFVLQDRGGALCRLSDAARGRARDDAWVRATLVAEAMAAAFGADGVIRADGTANAAAHAAAESYVRLKTKIDARGALGPQAMPMHHVHVRSTAGQTTTRSARWTWMTVAGMAAVVAVAMGVRQWRVPNDRSATTTYAARTGERTTVRLADGSRVVLAPGSSLRVPRDFGKATRHLVLDGEAYFAVASAAGVPFEVQVGQVRARVLGTAFTVRHYGAEWSTRVAVMTGKVALTTVAAVNDAARPPAVVLAAGMVGDVTDSSVTATTGSDLSPYTEWVNGKLVFRDTPVPQALSTLGHWYGLEFRLADSALARQHLTSSYEFRSSRDMLNALKDELDVTMTFDGNIVILTPRSVTHRPEGRRSGRDFITRHRTSEVGR